MASSHQGMRPFLLDITQANNLSGHDLERQLYTKQPIDLKLAEIFDAPLEIFLCTHTARSRCLSELGKFRASIQLILIHVIKLRSKMSSWLYIMKGEGLVQTFSMSVSTL